MRSWRMGSVRKLMAQSVVIAMAAALLGLAAPAPPASATGPNLAGAQLELQTVASGLSNPVALAWRPGDPRMYVAELGGTVRLVDTDGTVLPTPVLSLTVGSGGERGLVGLVFSPDGLKLYVDYADVDGTLRIVEYVMAGDTALTASARELLAIDHPNENHNGGQLAIGPDGYLYIAVGDGGGTGDPDGNAQNLDVLLGKILRIDPTPSAGLPYTIPADNPFVGQPNRRGEIWMYGLRNPWRFTFDSATGDMLIGDVGQALYEEVDYAPAGQGGANWGWNLREGFHPYNGAQPPDGQDPLFEESHADGYCALIGGYVYHGQAIPTLDGAYVFGDFCRSGLVGVAYNGSTVTDQRGLGVDVSLLSAFGQDNDGELYVASLAGTVSKLIPVSNAALSVGDASVVEGDVGTVSVSVPVSLSVPSASVVTARWATANGSAKAPGDFTASSGTVTFAPGQTVASVSVPVVGDGVAEGAEKFSVKLSSPVGAKLADAVASVNVLDDDAPLSVSVGDVVAFEGNAGTSSLAVPVSLSRPVPVGASVSVTVSTADGTAVAGSDYVAVPATVVSFGPGEQTKTVSVSVLGDTVVEKNETFKVNLKSPVGAVLADAAGTETIANDD